MKDKIQRLQELRSELFDIANSLAGDKTGTVACELHESANCILRSIKMLENGVTPEDNYRVMTNWMSRNLCHSINLKDG